MMHRLRCLCIVYVSEARNSPVLQSSYDTVGIKTSILQSPSSSSGSATSSQPPHFPYNYSTPSSRLIHTFSDLQYNRTSFYFACDDDNDVSGRNPSQPTTNHGVSEAIKLCKTAYELIDYNTHGGSHPTLGVVDHVCFSPIDASERAMIDTINIADSFCQSLNMQYEHRLPIFTYGRLSHSGFRLRDLRRSLHYFKPNGTTLLEQDIKSLLLGDKSISFPAAHYGLNQLQNAYDSKRGIMCVGVVPFVQNYNIRISPKEKSKNYDSGELKRRITSITKQIRSSDVEALTLLHGDESFEIACNLLNTANGTSVQQVYHRCSELLTVVDQQSMQSGLVGLTIESSYATSPSLAELLNRSTRLFHH